MNKNQSRLARKRCPQLLLLATLAWSSLTVGAGEPPRPNILFAIADDWGYGHAGAYGCKWVKTPAFDRVADEGILFSHAFTPNAKCAPSRACILTGRNSWQLKAAANHVPYFPPEFKTFCEALDEQGWFVGHTTKGWAPGIATKTFILSAHRKNTADPHWALCFGKRPSEELYDLKRDPDCVSNLAADPAFADRKRELERQMVSELQAQEDPRMFGRGEVFEQHPYANASQRNFHERYMKGEKLKAGWVEESDFEKQPLD